VADVHHDATAETAFTALAPPPIDRPPLAGRLIDRLVGTDLRGSLPRNPFAVIRLPFDPHHIPFTTNTRASR
jgi:hypothetical protein